MADVPIAEYAADYRQLRDTIYRYLAGYLHFLSNRCFTLSICANVLTAPKYLHFYNIYIVSATIKWKQQPQNLKNT